MEFTTLGSHGRGHPEGSGLRLENHPAQGAIVVRFKRSQRSMPEDMVERNTAISSKRYAVEPELAQVDCSHSGTCHLNLTILDSSPFSGIEAHYIGTKMANQVYGLAAQPMIEHLSGFYTFVL